MKKLTRKDLTKIISRFILFGLLRWRTNGAFPDIKRSVVIFAPLFEELLCRGVILRGLLHHITPAKAIFWSALMFAVMHLNPWQALPAFMVGLLMGWIYWKTGSLLATIFIHFVNNGFSFMITLLFPDMGADATFSSLMPFNQYIILYVFSILFTIAALWYLKSNYDKSISTEV